VSVPRDYPYAGWVLLPSFKPTEVTFVSAYKSFSNEDYGDNSQGGKLYASSEIFPSKTAAILEGHARLRKQQADLDKKQTNINKRRAALEKAA
jgi:hypothetical protein